MYYEGIIPEGFCEGKTIREINHIRNAFERFIEEVGIFSCTASDSLDLEDNFLNHLFEREGCIFNISRSNINDEMHSDEVSISALYSDSGSYSDTSTLISPAAVWWGKFIEVIEEQKPDINIDPFVIDSILFSRKRLDYNAPKVLISYNKKDYLVYGDEISRIINTAISKLYNSIKVHLNTSLKEKVSNDNRSYIQNYIRKKCNIIFFNDLALGSDLESIFFHASFVNNRMLNYGNFGELIVYRTIKKF